MISFCEAIADGITLRTAHFRTPLGITPPASLQSWFSGSGVWRVFVCCRPWPRFGHQVTCPCGYTRPEPSGSKPALSGLRLAPSDPARPHHIPDHAPSPPASISPRLIKLLMQDRPGYGNCTSETDLDMEAAIEFGKGDRPGYIFGLEKLLPYPGRSPLPKSSAGNISRSVSFASFTNSFHIPFDHRIAAAHPGLSCWLGCWLSWAGLG